MTNKLLIVSGGQSGVDRAALDVALALGIPYAGWCPRGGWAEDFPVPPGVLATYPQLRETPLADPAQRTEWNVRDSDAVLILLDRGGLAASRGTALARDLAARHGNPVLVVGLDEPEALASAAQWLDEVLPQRTPGAPLKLGIGGPRESEAPGIYTAAADFLRDLLRSRAPSSHVAQK
jgi:hypothetical protein